MSEEENEDCESENWITNQKQTDIESIQQSLSSVAEPQPRTMADDQLQQHRLSNNDLADGDVSSTTAASRGLEGGAAPVRTEGDSGAPLQEGCSGAPLSSRLNQQQQPPFAQPLDLSTAPRPAKGRVVEDRRERNLKKYFKSKQIAAEVEHQPENVSICRTCHHSCTDDRRDQVAVLQHQLQRLQETLNTQVGELKREVNVLQASLSQLRGATSSQHAKPVQANQIATYASNRRLYSYVLW